MLRYNIGMKKFARWTLLCFIPIVGGIVCFIVGNTLPNSTVTYAGMLSLIAGLPAMMIIFLIVGLILMSLGKLSGDKSDAEKSENAEQTEPADGEAPNGVENVADDNATAADEASGVETKEEAGSQKEREREMVSAVNRTSGFESRVKLGESEAAHVAEGMKNAPKWGIALGLTFFFLLVADVVVATVLAINRIFVGTIICAALFAVVIITLLIVMSVRRARATNGDISKAKKITEGIVKTCYMVGTATTRSGGMRHSPNSGTVRLHSVTYRVLVIADGTEYEAFTNQFYENDEKVKIAVMGKKHAKIIDDARPEEPSEITEEQNEKAE